MIPVLFDTNIYGKIVYDPDGQRVIDRIGTSDLVVLNFNLVRDELRQTMRFKTLAKRKRLRPALLTAYDRIVSQKPIPLSKQIENLASAYFAEYKVIGGNVGRRKVINDFRILACATLKNCSTIVSEDSHMMRSSKLMDARTLINAKRKLKSPGVIGYNRLRNLIGLS